MFLEAVDAVAQSSTPWKLDDLLPLARSDAFTAKETEVCVQAIHARKQELQRERLRGELTQVLMGETDKLAGARSRVDSLGGCEVEKTRISTINPYANAQNTVLLEKLIRDQEKQWYAAKTAMNQGVLGGMSQERYAEMFGLPAAQAPAKVQDKKGGV